MGHGQLGAAELRAGEEGGSQHAGQRVTRRRREPEHDGETVEVSARRQQDGHPDHSQAYADPLGRGRGDAAQPVEDDAEQRGHRAQDRHDARRHAALGGRGTDGRHGRQPGQRQNPDDPGGPESRQSGAAGHQQNCQEARSHQRPPHGDLAGREGGERDLGDPIRGAPQQDDQCVRDEPGATHDSASPGGFDDDIGEDADPFLEEDNDRDVATLCAAFGDHPLDV